MRALEICRHRVSFKTETALYCSQPRLRSASRPSWTVVCSVSWSCWPKSQRPSMFFQWKVNWISSLWPFVGGAHFSRFFFCCFQILTTISCSCRSSYRSRLQRGVEIRFVGHGRDWAASWLDSKAGSGIQNMKNIEFFFWNIIYIMFHQGRVCMEFSGFTVLFGSFRIDINVKNKCRNRYGRKKTQQRPMFGR